MSTERSTDEVPRHFGRVLSLALRFIPSPIGSGRPPPALSSQVPRAHGQASDLAIGSLPVLHDTSEGTWTTSFTSIVGHLARLNQAWDLDAPLTPSQRADSTAYAAFVASTAPPLLGLSLYVSSANWAAVTRPAYSTALPFPLTWTEPLARRRRMCAAAEHLGLSDLNIDDEPEDARPSSDKDARGFLKIPERLRPRRTGVRAALAPEQTNLIRLEAAGRECLGVLAGLLSQHEDEGAGDERRSFLLGGDRPTSLDCLALGHLSLMLAPEVPRPWLRDLLRRRYDGLCALVDSVRDELFGGDIVASLPWRAEAEVRGAPWRATRFARGVIMAVVPEDWLVGGEHKLSPRRGDEGEKKQWTVVAGERSRGMVALAALGNLLAGLGLVGGVLLYRHLSPFGAALYRWEGQRRRLGAAGALFGI